MKTFFAVLLVLCAMVAAAQEKSLLPQPSPGNVTLTLDEFNRLNELANKPRKKPTRHRSPIRCRTRS